jgi:hypothetical protein
LTSVQSPIKPETMSTRLTFKSAHQKLVYEYFSDEFPQVIRYVRDLLLRGYNPDQIEQIAEIKIGVCETSYSVNLIARYLVATDQSDTDHLPLN